LALNPDTGHPMNALFMLATHTETAVVVTDARGRIEWINRGFECISGYTLPEIRGQSPGRLLQSAQTDPQVLAQLKQALRDEAPFKGELLNRRKDGSHYWVALEIQPVRDARAASRASFRCSKTSPSAKTPLRACANKASGCT